MIKALTICVVLLFYGLTFAQDQESTTITKQETPRPQKIKVFPNPATNVVNVLGLKNSNKAYILISDVYGNAVLNHQWSIKNNALSIPISTLDSGIYSISIRSLEQSIKVKFYKK